MDCHKTLGRWRYAHSVDQRVPFEARISSGFGISQSTKARLMFGGRPNPKLCTQSAEGAALNPGMTHVEGILRENLPEDPCPFSVGNLV